MSDKPSYLGLLNAVSQGESRAHTYLTAWAAVTPSADVRNVLLTVAAREGEHGMSFAKRINELGYNLRESEDPNFAKQLDIARSTKTDLEKMEALGLGRLVPDAGKPDIFDKFFNDHSIDIRTGELLGRYIAEERDSGRLLKSCYDQLKAAAGGGGGSGMATDSSDRLASLEAKLDAVCHAVEGLCEVVGAPATAKRTNGRSNGRAKKPAGAKR